MQPKRGAKLLTVIGLTTMHAVCCITFMLYQISNSSIAGNMVCWNASSSHLYGGTEYIASAGYTCQKWSKQYPHKHKYDFNEFFPVDGSMYAAKNYCRDPGSHGYLWCYTNDPLVRWHACQIPSCNGTCFYVLSS